MFAARSMDCRREAGNTATSLAIPGPGAAVTVDTASPTPATSPCSQAQSSDCPLYLLRCLVLSLGGGFGSLCVQQFLKRYGNDANANRFLPLHACSIGVASALVLAAGLDGMILKEARTQSPGSIYFMPLFLTGANLGGTSLFLLSHQRL
ncbi:unnamed protein product [Symbiodinium sp. CCMP2456]|nr:unnamed protein product [Symbiodinium sp. CCMP2456]